ncbi:hypothetical protein [Variovorax gossypii]
MSQQQLPFLQHLGLGDDADERAIRRAYAQRLKQIDQEAEPEAFQALREAYETAMGWANYMQQRAQAAAQEAQPPQATPAEPAPESTDEATASPTRLADSETIARAVLDELQERLKIRPPEGLPEGRKLLEGMLDDARLLDLDAQFLFEWGVASILAQGWKPGHEFLFGPAMDCFKWREDRSRLLRLGHAGHFIDVAIRELEMYDRQVDTQRAPQRDMIRRLRHGRRPSDRELIQKLPLAEQLCATWPNWLHVVTNTQNILKWRQWDTEVPRWRRAVTGKPNGTAAKARKTPGASAASGQSRQSPAGIFFLVLLVLGGLGQMLSSNHSSSSYTPPAASYPRLVDPSQTRPEPFKVPSALQPPVWNQPSPPSPPPAPPPIAQFDVARKTVATLTKGKVDAKKCADTSEILGYHGQAHQKGNFGPAFDRLVLDCLVKDLWKPPVPLAAVDASLQRNQKRTKALMDKEIATARAWTSPPTAWRGDLPPPAPPEAPSQQPRPTPAPMPPASFPRTADDPGFWLTPGSPLSKSPPPR